MAQWCTLAIYVDALYKSRDLTTTYFLRIISLILLLCPFISKVTKFRFWRHFSIALYIGFCALLIHFFDRMTPSPWKNLKQPQNFGQNCQKVWNFALRAFSDKLRAFSPSRLNFKGRIKVNTDSETLKDSNMCSHSKFYWYKYFNLVKNWRETGSIEIAPGKPLLKAWKHFISLTILAHELGRQLHVYWN